MTSYEIVVSVFSEHNGSYGLDGLLLAASRPDVGQPRSSFLTFVDVFLGLVPRSRGLRVGMRLICEGGFFLRHLALDCDFGSVEFYHDKQV